MPRCDTTNPLLRADGETLVSAATARRTTGPDAVAWKAETNWLTPWAPVYWESSAPTSAGGSTTAVAV